MKIISKKKYEELLNYKEKYQSLTGEYFTFYTGERSRRAGLLQMSKDELVRIIFDLNNKCVNLLKSRGIK